MVGFILIHKKDLFNIKMEIYYQTIRVITKNKSNNRYSLDKFPGFFFENWPNITIWDSMAVENPLIICTMLPYYYKYEYWL